MKNQKRSWFPTGAILLLAILAAALSRTNLNRSRRSASSLYRMSSKQQGLRLELNEGLRGVGLSGKTPAGGFRVQYYYPPQNPYQYLPPRYPPPGYPPSNYPPPTYQQPPPLARAHACVTSSGQCPLSENAVVGTPCTCYSPYGTYFGVAQ